MEEHKHEHEHGHDHEHSAPRNSGLAAFSPKQTFTFGLVGGLLVLCSIGFFVLLGYVLMGDSGFNLKSAAKPSLAQANAQDEGVQNPVIADPREVDPDTDHILGAKNAKVTIIEYSDFQCPFCARFHPTMQKIVETYGKDVRWVYRHFPLESIHQNARPLALASECAAEQGKFWEFADAMIPDNGAGTLENYASKSGVNYAKMKSCIDSGKYEAAVDEDAKDAVAVGGQGTPYSVIIGPNGKTAPLSGAQPYEAVEAAIKSML